MNTKGAKHDKSTNIIGVNRTEGDRGMDYFLLDICQLAKYNKVTY